MEKWSNISENEVKSHTVVVAIPHRWLRQVVERIFVSAQVDCVCVENIEELYQSMDGNTALTIVDVFSYSQYYRDIFTQLKQRNSGVPIVALVSASNTEYQHELTTAGASAIVIKENADEELIPALVQVLRDREFNDAVARLLENQKQFITLFKEEVHLMGKEDGNIFGKRFGRRSFLKGSAAAAAVAGVAVASPGNVVKKALAVGEEAAVAAPEDQIFSGACRSGCNGGCLLKLHVRDEKLVKTSFGELPDEEYNKRICLKGLSHVQRVYDSNRLKYPLKRVGTRGSGEWEQISWDEAITTITDKWQELWKDYGQSSVALVTASGNLGGVHGGNALGWFRKALGMTKIDNATDAAIISFSAKALGISAAYNSNELLDMQNAKCIISWGNNLTESNLQSWRFVANAKEKGAKLIVIDTIYTTTASKADKFVSVRPGTDAVLAMSMMNVAIAEDLIDKEFIKSSTVGPFLVKESDGKFLRLSDLGQLAEGDPDGIVVRGQDGKIGLPTEIADPVISGTTTVNGLKVTTAFDLLKGRVADYPPEKAQEICDVPADTIRELLHMYVENSPSTIFMGYGLDHYVNGHYNVMSVMALAMITGNLGKRGASCGCLLPIDAFWANSGVYGMSEGTPGPTVSILHLEDVLDNGKFGDIPVTLKSLFIASSNPIGNAANYNKILEMIDRMELVVVSDITMSDSAQYADIVLPAAHWFEANDIFGAYSPNPYVYLQEKALEPLYESKPDFEICKMITEKLGLAKEYNITDMEFIEKYLDGPGAKAKGITLESMKKNKAARVLPKPFVHGEGGVFPTATGRAQFYLEQPAPAYNYGQDWDVEKERLPVLFEPPTEAWHENPLFKKYPFVLVQEHTRWRTHTQWGHAPWLRELDPEPIVKINPLDAEPRGIKDGDIVRVLNDRGYVVLKAVIQNGIRPGVLNIPKGWQRGQFIEGHYQELTANRTNFVCNNTPFYDILVDVQKR
ncbi:MAG: molybdopterin-dependent oxidoreductase [Desulfitobacterium sp.]